MSNDGRQKWVRGAGPVVVLVGLVGLAAWLGPEFRPQPASPGDGLPALLVLEDSSGQSGGPSRRLLRLAGRGEEIRPSETVWEGDSDHFDDHTRHRLVDNRYVVTPRGGVIDVWTRQVIYPSGRELLAVHGGRIVTRRTQPPGEQDVFAFDLRTWADEPLTGPEADRYLLAGVRSPDGTKSVEPTGVGLTLHRAGHPPQPLGSFPVGLSVLSSSVGKPPVFWLDDDRFLTQAGNGHLITVSPDGARTPVVSVPARTEVVSTPRLSRHPDGRIIYECGPDAFVIHPDAGTWERPEWVGLGHGFEASWDEDGSGEHTVRCRGKTIGRCRCWPHWPGGVVTAEGLLAVVVSTGEKGSGWGEVRVWSAATESWAVATLRPASLVGWMK